MVDGTRITDSISGIVDSPRTKQEQRHPNCFEGLCYQKQQLEQDGVFDQDYNQPNLSGAIHGVVLDGNFVAP